MGQIVAPKGGLVLHNALGQLRAKNLGRGKHPDGQGLWLVKRTKDAGKWILRLSVHGKRREMGLGRWPDVSIAEARKRAAEARKTLRNGVDPIFERTKAKHGSARLTVAEAIASCFEARKADLKRDGDAGRWMSPLKVHIIPKIGSYPIEEVSQHVLKDVLGPIWQEKTEAAEKALNRMSLTLKHAAALGLEVDLQATMKTRALLGKQRHAVTHIPSLPYKDERWPGKTGQCDKWIFCLTAAIVPHDRRTDEQATTPEPQPGIQGEGGIGCREGREDAGRVGAVV